MNLILVPVEFVLREDSLKLMLYPYGGMSGGYDVMLNLCDVIYCPSDVVFFKCFDAAIRNESLAVEEPVSTDDASDSVLTEDVSAAVL